MRNIRAKTREDYNAKKSDIETSLALSSMKVKDEARKVAEKIAPTEGRWTPVRRYLESVADKTGDHEALTLDEVKKQLQ